MAEGFLEHAVSENAYAGVAMTRRAAYMYGVNLAPGPTGQVSTGLGIAIDASLAREAIGSSRSLEDLYRRPAAGCRTLRVRY